MRTHRASSLGQLIVTGLDEDCWSSSVERRLRSEHPGGVILSARNLGSAGTAAELLSRITTSLEVPPILAIEEEGGDLDPLRAILPALPSARAAAQGGSSAVARLGALISRVANLLGFNACLAPVLDLETRSSPSLPGTRTFSSSPLEVARNGKAFLRALKRARVLGCAKHFPGLGSAQLDHESRLPVVSKPMAALWSEDLIPYRGLLAETSLVMVGRASYKAYDFDVPRAAMLSVAVVEGLLRRKLGFRRVALADGLELEANRQQLDLGEVAAQAICAGCDLLLLRSVECATPALEGLRRALDSGKLAARRVEEALARIRRVKKTFAPPRGKIPRSEFDQLAKEFEGFGRELDLVRRKIA